MTKQEEIKEGMAKRLCEIDLLFCDKNWEDIPEKSPPSQKDRNYYRRQAVSFLNYLNSVGCVLKVERELPHKWIREGKANQDMDCDYWDCGRGIKKGENYYYEDYGCDNGHTWCIDCAARLLCDLQNKQTGYVAVEPLIEDTAKLGKE